MPTLRRLTRPTDRRMGLVYGDDPRPVVHGDGLHAGYTLVTVQHLQAESLLLADGWERCAAAHPPALPDHPRTLAEAVVRGELLDVVALVDGATPGEVAEAVAYEARGQGRGDVLAVLHDAAGVPVHVPPGVQLDAVEVMPADPEHPVVAGSDGGDTTATSRPTRARRG